jgi:hypothetical protein
MKLQHLFPSILLSLFAGPLYAQLESSYPSSAVLYKVLVDDPSIQNQLWLHLQPLTVDGMTMNASVGSGLEAHWISPLKGIEFHGGIRGNFFNAMDLQKRASSTAAVFIQTDKYDDPIKNPLSGNLNRFLAWEAGGFYPIKEFLKNGKANISIPDQTGVSENLELNAKVLRTLGARLGVNSLMSTVSLNKAMEDQNLELVGNRGNRLSPKGATISSVYRTEDGLNSLFTSFASTGFYAGIGMQRRKNLNIKTETLGIISSNSILSFYADVMINPWTSLQPFAYAANGSGDKEEFEVDKIKVLKMGFRTGFEIRHNENPFISAGGEIGYRPAIQGQGFYAALRIGIPVFSIGNQSFSRPSTNVGSDQSIGK